ncbi:hypothetical protein D3C86_1917740 [compost metagenome]
MALPLGNLREMARGNHGYPARPESEFREALLLRPAGFSENDSLPNCHHASNRR